MKKTNLLLQVIMFFVLFLGGCSSVDKIKLEVSEEDVSTFVEIDNEELKEKIENGDSFVLFVYKIGCPLCNRFKKVLNRVIDENDIVIYGIQYINIEKGHELKSLMYVPTLVIYDEGKYVHFIDANEDEKYFVDDKGFVSFLDKYTYIEG